MIPDSAPRTARSDRIALGNEFNDLGLVAARRQTLSSSRIYTPAPVRAVARQAKSTPIRAGFTLLATLSLPAPFQSRRYSDKSSQPATR